MGAAVSSSLPWLRLADGSTVPPYEQLRLQLAEAVSTGRLPVGSRLPPVRTLAAELQLAVNTVARAYRELEQGGVVATRSRAGTVVTASGDDARSRLAEAAAAYAAVVRTGGFSDKEAVAYVKAALGH